MPNNPPKWTPGPWTAERANVGDKHPLFVVANADIAFRPPCDADAHLIAAAPELYDALEMIVNAIDDAESVECRALVAFIELDECRAALAKARGEQTDRKGLAGTDNSTSPDSKPQRKD